MRTGAIFARGSCRALKWVALVGMVFTLGAGLAAAQAKPNKPVLTVKGASATSVMLEWTVPAGGPTITSFATQHGDAPVTFTATSPTVTAVSGSNASTREAEITGLTAGTRASFRVGAVGPGGTTWSDVKHFTTENAPGVIGDLAVRTGDGMATVTWGRVTGARYYEYNFKLGDTSGDFTAAADAKKWARVSGGSGATSVTIPNLTNGSSYLFGVRAVNNGGPTIASPLVDGIPSGKPGAPRDLTATLGSPSAGKVTVTLNWIAPESDGGNTISGYEYEIADVRGWRLTGDTNTFFDITGLDADMAGGYTYRVRAVNDNGVGPHASTDPTDGPGPGPGPRRTSSGAMGQIHLMELMGATDKTIGGTKRLHVGEGGEAELHVTVVWKHNELKAMYDADDTADRTIEVEIKGDDESEQMEHMLPDWVSWIDHEGDAHWPNTGACMNSREPGRLCGVVTVKVPANPTDYVDSDRHTKMSTGKLTVYMPHDNHEAENDAYYIEAVYSEKVDLEATASWKKTTPVVVIEDDDPQEVTVLRNGKTMSEFFENQGSADFVVTAKPARIDLPLDVRLDVVDVGNATVKAATFSVSDANLTLNAGRDGTGNSDTVTVRFPDPDGNREDDKYDLKASVVVYSLSSGAFDTIGVEPPHKIDVYDIHNLPPLTVTSMSPEVMEGGERELTLTVNRNPRDTIAIDPETRRYTSEALTIAIGTGGDATMGSDYSLSSTSVMVEEHNGKAPWVQTVKVKVEVAEDEDVEEPEMLDLDFTVSGTADSKNGPRPVAEDAPVAPMASAGPGPDAELSLTLTDETEKLVSVKDDAYDAIQAALGTPPTVTTGMSGDLMGSNLFDYDSSTVSVAYGTSVEGTAVTASAAGGMVTIMGAMAGEAKVTITATATPNASSLLVNQTKSTVAQLTFPVMVVDADLVFMVAGPDDMNLAEGGMGGMVTVTTNRPVTENTEVMLMRDGSSSASEDDYMLEPSLITIMAGHEMGSTMVMATEDNMAEDTEMLTLFLVVDGMQMTDKSVSFYLWDAAVPALPIIAQLLLGSLLAVGGYRRYRRR